MTLPLLITFAICFMSGGLYFSSYKISRSTWTWYAISLVCSIPSFVRVINHIQG
jgi:hypothetical protein